MSTPKWTIYCHTHRESGRRYVGLTKKTMLQRWNQHVYTSKQTEKKGWSHFANAIRKYGKDAFDHEVLEICHSVEEANLAEEKWILHFDARNLEKGFNIAKGGDHFPHSVKQNPWEQDGFREKVSSSMKDWFKDPANAAAQAARSKEVCSRPEVRQKWSEATTRQFSDQGAREKMSETVKALYQDPEVAAKFRKGLETANRNRAARTHCKNGHEFTPANTRVNGKGHRFCRRCSADRVRERAYLGRTHCVNGHLWTPDNVRYSKNGRSRTCADCLPSHCKNGHEFTPANTGADGTHRICLTCRRSNGRISDARRRKQRRDSRAAESFH